MRKFPALVRCCTAPRERTLSSKESAIAIFVHSSPFAVTIDALPAKKNSQTTMSIKWRLAVLMADREIDYKKLAEATGMHPTTVSKHKNSKIMPSRLESETLEKYCQALKCQPGELLVWIPETKTQTEEQSAEVA